ncbi:hypothetical protein [Burkholderia sp. D-99]|uniref:hypothetical protein n=1 Tax=Burkholderia sp. D-99 TaxID=2717316 RepID=UPI00141E38CD|nr:hypothetical protein [Burkholderia sp. D-99]NHV29702.1 hypothetical protein [Burkholderia sp. D-99]
MTIGESLRVMPMSVAGRLPPMAEFPIERAGACRYELAAVAPDEMRLIPTLQKIDLPE